MGVMRELGFDQAAGLAALGFRPPRRLLPVVQSPDRVLTEALLTQLECGLHGLGLSVLRIDGLPDAGGPLSIAGAWMTILCSRIARETLQNYSQQYASCKP